MSDNSLRVLEQHQKLLETVGRMAEQMKTMRDEINFLLSCLTPHQQAAFVNTVVKPATAKGEADE